MRLSRIRLFIELIHLQLSLVYIYVDPRFRERELSQDCPESLPFITSLLTPPVQPVEQHLFHLVLHIVQASAVVCYAVIMVVSNEYQIYLPEDVCNLPVTHVAYRYVQFSAFLREFLLTRLPLYSEPATPARRAVVREP